MGSGDIGARCAGTQNDLVLSPLGVLACGGHGVMEKRGLVSGS